MTTAQAMRDESIEPLSVRHELLAVVRVAMAITFAIWLYLANNPFGAAGGDLTKRALLPYQAFARDRAPEDQRMFRELQVALIEAETIRSTKGSWPTADDLAAEGIEPFAVNPAIKGPRYSWQTLRLGRIVNYLGVPDAAGTTWLIWLQEPDPSAPEAFRPDEEHHQLLDGSVIHVAIWSRASGPREASVTGAVVQAPQFGGWTQIYAVSPPVGHAAPPS